MKIWPIRSGSAAQSLSKTISTTLILRQVTVCVPIWDFCGASVTDPDNNFDEVGSTTSSTFSSEENLEYNEHNVCNSMLDALCHFEVGVVLGALLDDVAIWRIALACHYSLDLLCDKTSSLPVVNDHVYHTMLQLESANVLSLATANAPALMQYVLDGSTWSSILSLLDTFNYLEFCSLSTQAVHSYFSCCTMYLDTVLTNMCRWTVENGGYRNVLRRHQNNVTY